MNVSLFQYHQKTKQLTPRVSGERFAAPTDTTFDLTPSGNIGSVQFFWNGTKLLIENREPWRANGDKGSLKFKDGINKLEATVYEKMQGKGRVLLKTAWEFDCSKAQQPKPDPKPDPKPVDPPKPPEGIVTIQLGVAASLKATSQLLPVVGKALKDLNIKAERGYYEANGWNPPQPGDEKTLKELHAAGYEIWLTITSPKRPTSVEQAEAYWAAAVKVYGPYVKAFIAGNEPNLRPKYFNGSASDYIKFCVEPASKACRAAKIRFGAGAISEDDKAVYLKELIELGLLKLIDFLDYHPYGGTPSVQKRRLLLVRSLIGSMPLVLTEWNIHGDHNRLEQWAAMIPEAFEACKAAGVSWVFYYCLMRKPVGTVEYAARGALLNRDGTPNEPFYSAVKKLALT